jgi:hypothetical protein
MRKWLASGFLALIILATCAPLAARPKTDTVTLKNGDRVTCEIKMLSRGKLEVSTDSMDKLYIEWADIVALNSGAYFRVTDSDGRLSFGSLEIREATGRLRVTSDTTIVNLSALSAVWIAPIEKTFWSRNKGNAKVGFSYSKSTDLGELYFDLSNRYRTLKTIVDWDINWTETDQADETKRRGSVGVSYSYLFPQSVTLNFGAKVERNDELNLKRRLLGILGVGYNLIATNESMLNLAAGLALNAEASYTEEGTSSSLEAVLHGAYSIYQYNHPKTAVDLTVDFYPSLTEQGRYRSDISVDIRREIVTDFFFDLEVYDQYDNKPTSGEGATSDYGIMTSLGYSWN